MPTDKKLSVSKIWIWAESPRGFWRIGISPILQKQHPPLRSLSLERVLSFKDEWAVINLNYFVLSVITWPCSYLLADRCVPYSKYPMGCFSSPQSRRGRGEWFFVCRGDADRQKALCSKDSNSGQRPEGLLENRYLPDSPETTSPSAISEFRTSPFL